jgi:hypothetical protein
MKQNCKFDRIIKEKTSVLNNICAPMLKCIFRNIVLLFLWTPCLAQNRLPVLQASGLLDIRDGDHLRKQIFEVTPERQPNHYYIEIPRKPHRVTFSSGRDSLSFDCRYGHIYEFIIVRGHDSCRTQIVANYKSIDRPKGGSLPDTIPFTLGSNNKIFIQAKLNSGPSLRFQFDFGADGLSTRTATLDKIKLKAFNTLHIGKLSWDSLKFDVYDHNMKPDEDGLLGNRLFLDKVVELNYDRKEMIIRDTLPDVSGYRKQPIILLGSLPLFQAKIGNGRPWLVYDSGDSGQASITAADARQYEIDSAAHLILPVPGRKLVRLNDLEIAGVHFPGLPGIISTGNGEGEISVLGNALLKRFNVIIDNRNGYIYLKPNHLLPEPFENIEPYRNGFIGAAVVLVLLSALTIRFILKRRKGQKMA